MALVLVQIALLAPALEPLAQASVSALLLLLD
jgi:hypothetical protein